MRIGLMIAGTAAIFILPTSHASAQSFDGPYVGVHAGAQEADIRNLDTEIGPLAVDSDRRSFTGGLIAGYDRQIAPRIVLGAEAGFDLAVDDKVKSGSAVGTFAIDPKWSLDLTGRAGYLVGPTTLFYVRGGYTNARVEVSAAAPVSLLSASEYRDSWTLGAGIERQILKKISARLEYRYSDLSEGEGTFKRHRLLTGIAYRF